MSHLNSRVARIVAGLAVVSAFAVAPMAAQAADTNVTGTLTGGSLTNTAPATIDFAATLAGVNQTVNAPVGPWSVNDSRGSNAGYRITLAASAPMVGGSAPNAGTGGSLTMTSTTATGVGTGPVTEAPQLLSTTAATIATAALNTGQGLWSFPTAGNLAVVVPANASAGAYTSTLTYTTATLVA
jgi:hypothetical protein